MKDDTLAFAAIVFFSIIAGCGLEGIVIARDRIRLHREFVRMKPEFAFNPLFIQCPSNSGWIVEVSTNTTWTNLEIR